MIVPPITPIIHAAANGTHAFLCQSIDNPDEYAVVITTPIRLHKRAERTA